MLKKLQGMLVGDVYMLCFRRGVLKQCSPPLMLSLDNMRNKAQYAISYTSMIGLSLIPLLVDCSSSVLFTHALALSAIQFVHKK